MEIIQGSSAPPSDPWSLSDAESWYKKIKIRNRLRGRPALSGGRPSFESLSRGMSLSRCGPRGLAPGLAASLRKRRGSTILPLPPPCKAFRPSPRSLHNLGLREVCASTECGFRALSIPVQGAMPGNENAPGRSSRGARFHRCFYLIYKRSYRLPLSAGMSHCV